MTDLAGGKLRLDEPAPHVVRITLDNPTKRNALDHEVLVALADVLPRLDARCLLITAAGGVFSAGYDLGALPDGEPAALGAALSAIEAHRYPVLAAVNGAAIGGGLELALACDLRVCSDAAHLGMPPARIGLVYPAAGLRRFLDAVGAPRTYELFFTARQVDAREALAWGLVNELVPAAEVGARGVAVAAGIAANAPLSLRGAKASIRALLDARGLLEPAVADELAGLRDAAFASDDFQEGLRAIAEKRAPRWQGS